MAHPDTHRAQAKSLLKKGLITEKEHDSMMAKIDRMAPPIAPNVVEGAAAAPPSAPASVPPGQGNLAAPETMPAA